MYAVVVVDLNAPIVYTINNINKRIEDEVLSHLVKLDDVRIEEYTVDLINYHIDGESFKEIDDEENEFFAILFRDLSIKIYDNGANEIITLENSKEEDMKLAKIIIKAYDYNVSKYYKLKGNEE